MDARELRRRRTAGFTLVEVLIAMVILAIALVSAQAVLTDRLITGVGGADRRMAGMRLANERLQEVQAEPNYGLLTSRYDATETSIPGFAGYVRTTATNRVRDAATGLDYTEILVTVTHPLLTTPLTRSAVVAAP